MQIHICDTKSKMGRLAAGDGAQHIRSAISDRGQAYITVATGASQLEMLAALVEEPGIEWPRVTVFHLDEYVGMAITHPASFRRYLKERFVEQWSVPGWMVPITAVMEVVGGLLILVPKLAMYGGGLIIFVMVGAAGSHMMAAEWPNAGFTLFLAVLASLVANARRLQASSDDG